MAFVSVFYSGTFSFQWKFDIYSPFSLLVLLLIEGSNKWSLGVLVVSSLKPFLSYMFSCRMKFTGSDLKQKHYVDAHYCYTKDYLHVSCERGTSL